MYDAKRSEILLTKEKTPEVVDELLRLNKGLINKQLSKFGLLGSHDAISLGYEALYKSIKTYDLSYGRKFSTYASVCIYNALGSYVRSIKTQIVTNTISYETPVDDQGHSILDTLESPLTADGNILSKCEVDLILEAMESCYMSLANQLHRDIVRLWIDSKFSAKQGTIAKRLGCSQTYVSNTLGQFKHKLKQKLEVK